VPAYPKSARLPSSSVPLRSIASPRRSRKATTSSWRASYPAIESSYFAPTRSSAPVGAISEAVLAKTEEARDRSLGLQVDANEKTFFWSGKYHENFAGRDTLEVQLNVFEKFAPVLTPSLLDSPFVMLGAIMPTLQLSVVDQFAAAKKKPLVLADTFDCGIHTMRADLEKLLRRPIWFVINEMNHCCSPASATSSSPASTCARWPEVGRDQKGGHGSLLFSSRWLFRDLKPTPSRSSSIRP